jgi:copper resistance protein C
VTGSRRILPDVTKRYGRLRAVPLILGALILLALPLAASAHSEFVSASPADGSAVTGTPDEIVLTFSAELDKAKSSIILLDSTGTQVAKAGVDPADNKVMRLTPPSLEPGAYEIDWTSVATDGDLLRGKVDFTVIAPTPSPSIAPTATPSAVPTAGPTASPAPTPSPAPSAANTPSSDSGAAVIIPVLVAIVLIAVLGAMLLRGRMGGGAR